MLRLGLLGSGLLIGWIAGSIVPLPLWLHGDCHRLGGVLRVVEGPGKLTECVIPWDRRRSIFQRS